VERVTAELARGVEALYELGLGRTVLGTGIGAHPDLGRRVIALLAPETGEPYRPAANLSL
jgi:fumarate hydratase class II